MNEKEQNNDMPTTTQKTKELSTLTTIKTNKQKTNKKNKQNTGRMVLSSYAQKVPAPPGTTTMDIDNGHKFVLTM